MTISPPGLVNIACSVFLLFPLDDLLEMDYHDKNSTYVESLTILLHLEFSLVSIKRSRFLKTKQIYGDSLEIFKTSSRTEVSTYVDIIIMSVSSRVIKHLYTLTYIVCAGSWEEQYSERSLL